MSYINADDVLPNILVKEIQKYAGRTIAELSKVYYLSEKRIQGIIHEYESSKKKKDGGFKNE